MGADDIRPEPADEQEGVRLVPAVPEKLHEGKDELNFAEFPLGTIAERIDPKQKTLVYEDKIYDTSKGEMIARKLTITGSDLMCRSYVLSNPLVCRFSPGRNETNSYSTRSRSPPRIFKTAIISESPIKKDVFSRY